MTQGEACHAFPMDAQSGCHLDGYLVVQDMNLGAENMALCGHGDNQGYKTGRDS